MPPSRWCPGRGDEAKRGGSGTQTAASPRPPPIKPRDMYEPDLHIDTLKLKARNSDDGHAAPFLCATHQKHLVTKAATDLRSPTAQLPSLLVCWMVRCL